VCARYLMSHEHIDREACKGCPAARPVGEVDGEQSD
jgi:hypothetical protein